MLQGDRRWGCRLLAVSVVSSSLFCHPVPRFLSLAYAPLSKREGGKKTWGSIVMQMCSLLSAHLDRRRRRKRSPD